METNGADAPEAQSWISGEELARAVARSPRTKTQIAKDIGVTRTYLFRLMDIGVSDAARVEIVRREMALWLDYNPYSPFSDDELAGEIVRRLTEYRSLASREDDESLPNEGQGSDGIGTLPQPPHRGVIEGTLGKRPRSDNGE